MIPPIHVGGPTSPLRLYLPEPSLRPLVPAALHLMQFVPGRITRSASYQLDDQGLIARREDRFDDRTIVFDDGARIRVTIQGSEHLGLPTVEDWDFLIGLFVLRQAGLIDDEGWLKRRTYAAISEASARDPHNATDACRTALMRWGISLRTTLDLNYRDQVEAVRNGGGYPAAPGGRPEWIEEQQNYSVLHYDTVRYRDRGYDLIRDLRVDPVWLGQADAGIAVWIDPARRARLGRNQTAKALYQWLGVRGAQDKPLALTLSLEEMLQGIQKPPSRKKAEDAMVLDRALGALVREGILGNARTQQVARGEYVFEITPGPALQASQRLRGIGAADPDRVATLAFHCRHFHVGDNDARAFMRQDAGQLLQLLRRAYYETSVLNKSISGGWIRDGMRNRYDWADPEYIGWLAKLEEQAVQSLASSNEIAAVAGRRPATLAAQPQEAASAAPEDASAAPAATDPLWGTIAEHLRSSLSPMNYRFVLGAETDLLPRSDTLAEELLVRADSYTIELLSRHIEEVQAAATAELGRDVRVRLEVSQGRMLGNN